MESVWLYLAEPRPGAGAECPEQQRWKESLMPWVPRQLGSNINRLHGECVQPLLAGRMASEARRWGKQRAHACTAHTVIKEENGSNPMAESKPRTRPPSSPPTGQEHRAPSLTALISNGGNTEKKKKKQAQTRNSMNCYRLMGTAGSCHQPQPCPRRKAPVSRGAGRGAGAAATWWQHPLFLKSLAGTYRPRQRCTQKSSQIHLQLNSRPWSHWSLPLIAQKETPADPGSDPAPPAAALPAQIPCGWPGRPALCRWPALGGAAVSAGVPNGLLQSPA